MQMLLVIWSRILHPIPSSPSPGPLRCLVVSSAPFFSPCSRLCVAINLNLPPASRKLRGICSGGGVGRLTVTIEGLPVGKLGGLFCSVGVRFLSHSWDVIAFNSSCTLTFSILIGMSKVRNFLPDNHRRVQKSKLFRE